MDTAAAHLLLELDQCDANLLDNVQHIERTLLKAANKTGARVLGQVFHKFKPLGVTGVVSIAESHLCIHTWPEYRYAAVDIFTCGKSLNPNGAAQIIIRELHCNQPSITEIKRGPNLHAKDKM